MGLAQGRESLVRRTHSKRNRQQSLYICCAPWLLGRGNVKRIQHAAPGVISLLPGCADPM